MKKYVSILLFTFCLILTGCNKVGNKAKEYLEKELAAIEEKNVEKFDEEVKNYEEWYESLSSKDQQNADEACKKFKKEHRKDFDNMIRYKTDWWYEQMYNAAMNDEWEKADNVVDQMDEWKKGLTTREQKIEEKEEKTYGEQNPDKFSKITERYYAKNAKVITEYVNQAMGEIFDDYLNGDPEAGEKAAAELDAWEQELDEEGQAAAQQAEQEYRVTHRAAVQEILNAYSTEAAPEVEYDEEPDQFEIVDDDEAVY